MRDVGGLRATSLCCLCVCVCVRVCVRGCVCVCVGFSQSPLVQQLYVFGFMVLGLWERFVSEEFRNIYALLLVGACKV